MRNFLQNLQEKKVNEWVGGSGEGRSPRLQKRTSSSRAKSRGDLGLIQRGSWRDLISFLVGGGGGG